jgi:A/G-specific adenine glycosylase
MPLTSKKPHNFSRILLSWHNQENFRLMPWKGEKDPYRVWISEIILQQTRVEQGLAYYNRFVKAFPTIQHLAEANEKEVFKLWEGLGYYSRCRNLIASAKFVVSERAGMFPSTYDEIKQLKGVGPYTAAAISSFAFELPFAVLDGNVFRVLSRIFGIFTPVDSTEGKKQFITLADQLLEKSSPAIYNQAIMDFGATICKPVPTCSKCPFNDTCFALQNNCIKELPVKQKKAAVRKRWFYYLVLRHGNTTAIRQRTSKDIWQELHEFPLLETEGEQDWEMVINIAEKNGLLPRNNYVVSLVSNVVRQQLSHQLISGQFIEITLKKKPDFKNDWQWLTKKQLQSLAFPKFINSYLG